MGSALFGVISNGDAIVGQPCNLPDDGVVDDGIPLTIQSIKDDAISSRSHDDVLGHKDDKRRMPWLVTYGRGGMFVKIVNLANHLPRADERIGVISLDDVCESIEKRTGILRIYSRLIFLQAPVVVGEVDVVAVSAPPFQCEVLVIAVVYQRTFVRKAFGCVAGVVKHRLVVPADVELASINRTMQRHAIRTNLVLFLRCRHLSLLPYKGCHLIDTAWIFPLRLVLLPVVFRDDERYDNQSQYNYSLPHNRFCPFVHVCGLSLTAIPLR